MEKKRIHKGMVGISMRRVNDHARFLIHNQAIVIFINDIERDRLGGKILLRHIEFFDTDPLTCFDRIMRCHIFSIYEHGTVFDHFLKMRPGMLMGHFLSEEHIEALLGLHGFHHKLRKTVLRHVI